MGTHPISKAEDLTTDRSPDQEAHIGESVYLGVVELESANYIV
jgi:hypothetical protein